MSKKKDAVLWICITYRDTVAARRRVLKAADALFRKADVTSRGDFSDEDVIAMVKTAVKQAERRKTFTAAEIREARERRATVEITAKNDGSAPHIRILWPDGEVSEGELAE